MPDTPLRLSILPGRLAVCRLDPLMEIPASGSAFFSATRTTDELSVVCDESDIPEGARHESGWRVLKIEGPLEFGQTGVLLSIAAPLAEAGISILAVSTFDTDYVLIKEEQLDAALPALSEGGLEVQVDSSDIFLRPATVEDGPFLWEMLAEAAREASVEAVAGNPGTARYVEGWGREGDLGFVAVSVRGEPLGAAWVRLLRGENAGYGYVDDDTPELAIGLRPEVRGKGIGTRLLSHLLEGAKSRFGAVSLSVRADNPARRLYDRMGFEPVRERRDQPDGSDSTTMKLNFTDNTNGTGVVDARRPSAGGG